jgi:hypothetical protein
MNIREMHYAFKMALNKLDSQQNINLRVPQIDVLLNEAQMLYIKLIAEPRTRNQFGFEVGQRSIDDLKNIVVDDDLRPITATGTKYEVVSLPDDYLFFAGASIDMKKGTCVVPMERVRVIQHDDKAEESPFDRSDFEWREVNIRFFEDGIKVFNDGTFSIDTFTLDYIREPLYMHNAQDFNGATYTRLDGTVLITFQDCELSAHTHQEIVDLAVLIAAGNIEIPGISLKEKKVNLSQI